MTRRRVVLLVAVLIIGVGLPVGAHYLHQGSVDGTVLLPDGRPAPGAQVFCPAAGEKLVFCQGHADQSGKFHLYGEFYPSGPLATVLALQPGYACAWAHTTPGQPVTLRLGADPATLSGTVVNPLAAASALEPAPPARAKADLTRVSPPAPGVENTLGSPPPGRSALAGAPPAPVSTLAAGAQNSMGDSETAQPAPAGAGPAPNSKAVAGAQNSLSASEPGKPVPGGSSPAPVSKPAPGVENSVSASQQGQPAAAGNSIAAISGSAAKAPGGTTGGMRVYVWQLLLPTSSPDQEWVALPYQYSPFQASVGADGKFSLPGLPREARVWLTVTGPGLGARSVYVAATQTDLHVIMQPEATIAGRVTREGQPVAGVLVMGGGAYATTAADGTYRLTGLAAGWITVEIPRAPSGYVAVSNAAVQVAAGEHRQGVDLALTPGATLRGRVAETGSGRPLAGVAVQVSWPDMTNAVGHDVVRTGADGSYQAHMPAGRAVMTVQVFSPDLQGWSADPEELTVSARQGQALTGLNFRLSPPAHLQGRVVGADGRPAVGVSVGAPYLSGPFRGEHPLSQTTTDQRGRFSLPASDPRHLNWSACAVIAHDDRAGLVGVAFPSGISDQVVIHLRPGAYVLAHVQDMQGHPLPGVRMMLTLYSQGAGEPPGRHFLQWPLDLTDARGDLRAGPLPAGMVVSTGLSPELQNLLPAGGRPFFGSPPLVEGQRLQLPTIRLAAGGTPLQAQVVDSAGRPVEGAPVEAMGVEGVVLPVGQNAYIAPVTDAGGDVTVRAPAQLAGTWLIAAHPGSALFAARQLTGHEAQPIRLVLRPPAALTGRVVDAQGHPVPSAQLYLEGPPILNEWAHEGPYNVTIPAQTGADGKFTCEGLISGCRYVMDADVMQPWASGKSRPVTLQPGQRGDVGEIVIKPPPRYSP